MVLQIVKNVYQGNFESKFEPDDSYLMVTHKTFLEKHFDSLNIKHFKRSDFLEKLKLLSTKSDGKLLSLMLKYRNQI